MRLPLSLSALLVVALVGCDAAGPAADAPLATSDVALAAARGDNGVVHSVSVGSPDIDLDGNGRPEDDRNFSATAQLRADGTVRGTHTDVFKTADGGSENVHATVDCLVVSGNTAYWSGVITTGSRAGDGYFSAARDNGTSEQEAPDEITYTFNPTRIACDDPRVPRIIGTQYFPIRGQVTVR